MNLTVKPAGFLTGSVELPASKSYTIRALLVASVGGKSNIINPSFCDDVVVALRTAQSLGAKITRQGKKVIRVSANPKTSSPAQINVGESGTVLRFLLPLAALRAQKVKIVGEGTLKSRPNFYLTQVLRDMGVDIIGRGKKQCVPIEIRGGRLTGGRVEIDGSLSSQFISALLITCPRLEKDTELYIKGKQIVSETYITMTLQVLKKCGIKIIGKGSRIFNIPGQQKFKGLGNFTVPSDYGLAAFLIAAAVLVKSDITLTGFLRNDFIQADGAILSLLKKMGVQFQKTARAIRIKGPFRLRGGNFSLKDCPDLLPIMSILALFANGKTRLYDIGHARVKESDRISDLRDELLKINARVFEKNNEMIIEPQTSYKNDCLLDPHHDHRLAMAFSVLGLKLGARVKDIECVAKSYPDFVRDFMKMGSKVTKS